MSERCSTRAHSGSFSGYPCAKPATKEHGGKWYCGTHHPDAVQARRDKADEKYNKWSAEQSAKFAKQARDGKRSELFPELVKALDELWAVTPSAPPGIGLEGARERHAAACKLAVDVLAKSKALL